MKIIQTITLLFFLASCSNHNLATSVAKKVSVLKIDREQIIKISRIKRMENTLKIYRDSAVICEDIAVYLMNKCDHIDNAEEGIPIMIKSLQFKIKSNRYKILSSNISHNISKLKS